MKINIRVIYVIVFALCSITTWANVKQVAAGYYHSLIVTTDGTLWACGSNSWGQLGDSTTIDRKKPVKIMDGVSSVAAGGFFSLIVKTDGTLWACGKNGSGQLGDGTTNSYNTPVKIMDGVSSVAAGEEHSLIVKTDGTLLTCGWQNCGQLGDGKEWMHSETPVKIMDNVSSVAAGIYHSLIVKTDGTLWACGGDGRRIGKGTNKSYYTPVEIMDGVSSVAAGGFHSLFVKTNGTLLACGYNNHGQLGNNSTTDPLTTVEIMDDVSSVAAGLYHSLIVKTDGTLWTCGINEYGQLGDNTIIDRKKPVKIMDGVSSVAAGYSHSLIVKTDGTLWACGRNNEGQLGDEKTEDSSKPEQIFLSQKYHNNNIDYLLYDDKSAEIKSIAANGADLTVPEKIEYDGVNYTVTIVGDSIFNNGIVDYNLRSVSFPSTITEISEDAFGDYYPPAIFWNSDTPLPSGFFNTKYNNSNTLLYAKSKEIAPSNVKNLIVNGEADSIMLKEGSVFYCPQPFKAKTISFTHNYQMATGVNEAAGWESISLPFTVQTITHESKGEIVSFADTDSKDGKKLFWLYQLGSNGFVKASTIEANTPYLISMPNNKKYTSSYCLNGKVTFSAQNAMVESSAEDKWHTATYDGNTFLPCFSFLSQGDNYYMLNVTNDAFTYAGSEAPGSVFVSNYRSVQPFEGYLYNETSNSRVLPIIFTDDVTLGIEEILADKRNQHIYNIKGQIIGTIKETDLENALNKLSKELYIINGKKVVK